MRILVPVEHNVSGDENINITADERVVSIRVRNIGAISLKTGWNTEAPTNPIDANDFDEVSAGDNGILVGSLTLKFNSAGGSAVVLMLKAEKEEICD